MTQNNAFRDCQGGSFYTSDVLFVIQATALVHLWANLFIGHCNTAHTKAYDSEQNELITTTDNG